MDTIINGNLKIPQLTVNQFQDLLKQVLSDKSIYLTKYQAAERLDVHFNTIDNWRKKGILIATLKGGRYFYDSAAIEALKKGN